MIQLILLPLNIAVTIIGALVNAATNLIVYSAALGLVLIVVFGVAWWLSRT